MKESIGATTITKKILNLEVNFTVGELLPSAPASLKQLTRAISGDEVIQFRVNTLGLAEALKTLNPYFWYSMGSSKTKLCLVDGSKVTALLNTSVEINVMPKKLIEDVNLAMRQGPKLELVSHTSHSWSFFSLCEDIEVVIWGY